MWLVLCTSTDHSAIWLYQGLRQLAMAPVELVLAESLGYGCSWEHRLNDGGAELKFNLPDGRHFCSSTIRGAINRLVSPPSAIAQQAASSDREYALAEQQAFYLSWLHGLPGVVINRPSTMGLCGPWLHPSEWIYRAARAGLPVPRRRYRSGLEAPELSYGSLVPPGASTVNLISFRGQLFGGNPGDATARACANLAQQAGTEILGIELFEDEHGFWTFAGANCCPELCGGGRPLIQSLAQALAQGGRS